MTSPEPLYAVSRANIPVLLLAGFLGAGKTTFLNYVLTEKHGEKIAVIVNEFGQIGVDQELIVGKREHIVEMSNGCICCSVKNDLVDTLLSLARDRGETISRFERVIIETTGLADPIPLIQTFLTDRQVAMEYELEAVVVVIDAKHIEQQRKFLPLAEEQIACADILILNKIDLVTPIELKTLRSTLACINPLAPILEAKEGAVPLQELWNKQLFDAATFVSKQKSKVTDDHHDHLSDIKTVLIEGGQPISREKFEEWLEAVLEHTGPDMLRYKGFLLVESAKEKILLQGVHREYRLTEEGLWEDGSRRQTQIVFIGRDLKADWLERSWREHFPLSAAHRHE